MTDPVVATRPPVSALLLGYAGLLPPVIAILWWLVDAVYGGMSLALSLL